MKRGDDPLAELFEIGFGESLSELRLADQQHLQQGFPVRLKVRQHAQLFERVMGEPLHLVDDNQSDLSLVVQADQLVLQSAKQLSFAAAADREPELSGNQP